MKTTISLDFDGVLHYLQPSTFVCNEQIDGEPIPGAREWCWDVWNSGKADLIVSSGRCSSESGIDAIIEWLEEWGFPPMPVSRVKPVAHVYVDDRAYRFDGNWKTVDVEDFVQFRAWWDE